MADKKKSKGARAVKKNWRKDEVIKLIENYEQRPDLWNPSSQKYHDR